MAQLRFGVAACQRCEDGYFTAYRQSAAEHFDFVFHYGDYLYGYRVARPGERPVAVVRVMPGEPDEIYTLDDYRHRYAIYKTDPDLQAAHASTLFVMSYDNHEVDNNWAGDVAGEHTRPELFLLRRAAALQAWYERMPVRKSLLPRGPDILAYRRLAIGGLMSLNVLDTRLFRSDQPCGDGIKADCREALDSDRTMLGDAQERWLYNGFNTASARWTVLGQQVMVMRHDRDPAPQILAFSMDKWDGAVAARDRLFAAVEDAKLANFIVLSGDIHNHWAGELKKDFDDERSATLGVEFVATSISSGGDGFDANDAYQALLAQNPHIKFFNNQHGYVRHTVTPDHWQADFQVVDQESMGHGRVSTRKSFVVERGRNGLAEA